MRRTVAGTPADPTVEFATLEIDGETYSLAYDFNAIAEAEKLAQCNLLHGLAAELISTASASQFRGLFYAALRKGQPKITIEQAGLLIRIDTLPDISKAMSEAYNLSMPVAKRNPPEAGAEEKQPAEGN